MLPDSTLELSWDHEIQNHLDPALSIKYLGSSSLFFKPSASSYNFSVSHRTYCSDTDNSMTVTTKIRGLGALASYLDLRCEAAGHWRLATIVDKAGRIVFEFSWKGRQGESSRTSHGFDFGMFGQGEKWGKTHDELLQVWKNMV